jgi:hypothetical protein
MKTTSEQTADRANQALGRPSPIKKPTMVLGGILFLALLLNPVQSQEAILPGSYSTTLAWTGSLSSNVAGYLVNYGTASGQYPNSVNVGKMTTSTVQGLTGGTTYFFVISCYDTNGLASPFSNEITYVPGLATVGITAMATGPINLTLNGPIGQSYDILASETLANWVVIGAVTMGVGGSVKFTDTNAANFPTRFYCTQPTP